ncbi:hypothetical protein BGY98DRAFT_1054054 [Russula aff. rugulosa BPL654]|nr:hypothetical protein BGY98DRAFT_1054054 [Russula aff. rugulosa BPL654]
MDVYLTAIDVVEEEAAASPSGSTSVASMLRLGVGASLVISALRCGAQLIVVTLVLRMWAVVRLALLLNALYGFEIVDIQLSAFLALSSLRSCSRPC